MYQLLKKYKYQEKHIQFIFFQQNKNSLEQNKKLINRLSFVYIILNFKIFNILSQQLMNFNYQNYVNRMKYEPYQWPPDISLAQLHSRVSQQGPINQNGVQCPCCKYKSKKKLTGWLNRDISEDCQELGSSVPAYFGLLKYYILAIFIVICINGIYPIWTLFYTCQNFIVNEYQACLKVGLLYYLDYNIQQNILQNNHKIEIINNLVILETVTYYFLLFVNLSSVWYLFYMQKKEESCNLKYIEASKNALIIGNIKTIDPEIIKQKFRVQTKLQIIDIIPLKEIKKYHEIFIKRNTLYYNLMSLYVKSQDPKQQIKINKMLYYMHKQFLKEKKRLQTAQINTILIIFKSSEVTTLVFNHYSMPRLSKYFVGTRALIEQFGLSKQIYEAPYYISRTPHVKEIKWQNSGQSMKIKYSGKIKTFLIAIGIIALLFFILQAPLRYSLQTHTGQKDLSSIQKIFPILLSFLLFGISIMFRNYMVVTTKKRNPLNEYEASSFVLYSSMIFHLVFYIIIPTLFFFIRDGINTTVKLYVIAQQARTFIFMQVILCFIDIPYRMWKNKKISVLGDQREGFKYNQKMLHKIVEYRDFPLQQRLQSMFKIWSLALFYSFYLPYLLYYIFIALILLYALQKRNFYLHYTLRRSISLKLEKNFLINFVNFFIIFQCITFIINAQYDWMIFTTIPITFICLALNFIFWKIFLPKLKKEKQSQELKKNLQQKLLKKLSEEQQEAKQKQDKLLQHQKAVQVARQYAQSYNNFLQQIKNDELDKEIQQYLSTFQFYKQTKDPTLTEIQLASNYTQNNNFDQYNNA